MMKKHSNKEGSVQNSSTIKWKWFIQKNTAGGLQGGTH